MLDIKQVVVLRKEIVLGSSNVADYENSFNIHPENVKRFFDGYIDFLQMLQEEDEEYGITSRLSDYNTADNLQKYMDTYEENEDLLTVDKIYAYMRQNRMDYTQKMYDFLTEQKEVLGIE